MRRWMVMAVFATAVTAPEARAEGPFSRGIDPVPHKLATTSDAFLTQEGARTAPAGSWGLTLGADYNSGLLGLRLGGDERGRLLEDRLDLHLLASWSATNWLEFGLDLPVTAWQSNDFSRLARETGFRDRAPGSAGFGDVRTLAKFRILSEERAGVGLAAIGELRLPTGAEEDFLGDGGVVIAPRAVVEKTFAEKLRVALEAGYRARTEAGQYLNLYVGDEIGLSLAASYALPTTLPGGQWSAFGEMNASTQARAPFNSPDSDAMKSPLEGLLGLRTEIGDGFHAMFGGGAGIGPGAGYGSEAMRLFAAVGYRKTVHDRDGDGVEDSEDSCPDVPEDSDDYQDSDGCPDPDNDGDGVPDEQDLCPINPGPKEYDGCPDSDGDEIPDREDECPTQKGPATNEGCPAGDPLALFDDGKISLRGAVNFDTGRASIQRDSLPVLDQVAAVLKAHPEVKQVRVDGHTDSVGSNKLNRDLSQRRAAAVVEYLVSQGVTRERIRSAGFGEDQPVADNGTALGRARNRRVEFTILEQAK